MLHVSWIGYCFDATACTTLGRQYYSSSHARDIRHKRKLDHAAYMSVFASYAQELEMLVRVSLDQFSAQNGVLLFLYSVILSRV